MRHFTNLGPAFEVSTTDSVKENPINGSKKEFTGEGFVSITSNGMLVPLELSRSSNGITKMVVDENVLTIVRGKREESYQIIVGSRSHYRLLPDMKKSAKGLVS